MLTKNNIQYRNLEEQVRYNTSLLNLFPSGIVGERFAGIVSEDMLGSIKKGQVALVGDAIPYRLYYVDEEGMPIDLGIFPNPGPQGIPGESIKGDRGEPAANWILSPTMPAVGPAGEPYMNTETGDIYQSNGTSWILVGTIRGP